MRSPEHRSPHLNKNQAYYESTEAFRILPPDNGEPTFDPPTAPQPYRLTPTTRRHKNMAFAIVAESGSRPGSRSPSPSGRVSPFRGRGFNPIGSRHASPNPSPPPEEKYQQHSPQRSRIPKLTRRGSATAFGERIEHKSSPNRRKLQSQFSQSLSNLSSNKVVNKPPPSPGRGFNNNSNSNSTSNVKQPPAFQRLSPIIGSSPEPSQSQSSPKISNVNRISNSQSQSRFSSPKRGQNQNQKPPIGNRVSSRPASRNQSRNVSRETSPSKNPLSPSRVKNNYRNIQAKVNSFSRPKPKVPPKPQNLSTTDDTTEDEDYKSKTSSLNRRRLERKESVVNNNNNSNTRTNSKTNVSKTGGNATYRSSNNNNNNSNNNKTINGTANGKDGVNNNVTNTNKSGNNSNNDNKTSNSSTNNNNREQIISDAPTTQKASVPVKLIDLLQPSTTAVVSSTTTTVTQPLKIDAKIDTDTPLKNLTSTNKSISPMVDGRVLSATSVSNAMNKMNDTVLDTQTLMKEHGIPKLSPAASTIIAMSHIQQKNPALDTKNATTALPSVETTTTSSNGGVVSARVLEQHVQNNMSRLIGPDQNNSVQKSVNDRMKEARTVVAKPIKITVKEKPMDVEVQSGNIRFETTNGINERPGLPPPQNATNNQDSQEQQQEQPPKGNICTRMKKTFCSCRGKKDAEKQPMKPAEEDNSKTGCFSCCRSKKPDVTIQIENEEPKPTFWEKVKCCGKNKVSDTTSCFPTSKRKESWAERRDSILSEAVTNKSSSGRCSNVFRKMFCVNLCCKKKQPSVQENASRRASMMSKKKSLTPSVPVEDNKPKIDISLVEHTSAMKAAIPVLPVCLAWFCLVMNCIAPGTGTVFSGMFCLCIGKPRFSQKDGPKPRFGAFIIDLIIGFGQFFTVLFCLVGWGWSIWWGVIMLRLAKKNQKIKFLEAQAQQNEPPRQPQGAHHHNHHPRESALRP